MCGRFTQQRPTSELAEIFEATDLADDPGNRYNIAPTDEAVVVVQREDQRALVRFRWGLIPHWGDPKLASRTFNARAETIGVSPAFREALPRRRCLVPVDSFYEWRVEGRIRQPYRIAAADGGPLVLAGLWAGRRTDEGEVRRTFTIVTTRASSAIAGLHDRMPVILPAAAWGRWLDARAAGAGEVQGLLVPSEAPLEIHAVPPLVNNVRNDGPELVRPLSRLLG